MKLNTAELVVKQAAMRDVMSDMARFHGGLRTFDGELLRAGRIVVLQVGKKKVRVVARGPAGVLRGEITLDSGTRERLGLKAGESAQFSFRKAGMTDEFLWAWGATDAMPRVAARLSALSVGLGLIGLILGVFSLWR